MDPYSEIDPAERAGAEKKSSAGMTSALASMALRFCCSIVSDQTDQGSERH